MTPVSEILSDLFRRPESGLFEPSHQTPAEFQANLHEAYVGLLHTVRACEQWQRTEDRIDAAVRAMGTAR